MTENKVWWSDGVRFECQGSGKCCVSRGEYGYVYLTLLDRKRLASFLNIPTRDFTRKYCHQHEGWFYLKDQGEQCRFLKNRRCTIYEARPTQCRTWPFWPENMKAKAWKIEVENYCPGVGKGKLFSANEIRKLLKVDAANE